MDVASLSSRTRGVLAVSVAAAAFGALGTIATLFYQAGLTPYAVTAGRAIVGAIAMAGVLAVRGDGLAVLRRLPRRDQATMAGIVLAGSVASLCVSVAFALMAVVPVVAIYYLYPLGVAVWGGLRGDEPLTMRTAAGVGIAVAGVAAVLAPWEGHAPPSVAGIIVAAVAAISGMALFRLIRAAPPSVTPVHLSAYMLAGVAFVAILVAIILGQASASVAWVLDPRLTLLMVVAGIVTAVVPNLLIPYGIRRIGATDAATIMYGEPISAVFFAAAFLGQPLGPTTIAGTVAVVAGAVLVTRRPDKPDGRA
jgi:drug/metabolite transporter, DME family